MKKLSFSLSAAAMLCGLIAPQANADEIKKVSPVVAPAVAARITKVFSTKVAGAINLNLPQQLTGLQCSDLTVFAQSTEMLPAPPGGFATGHKWTRSGQASGSDINACSYSIAVPGNSAFNLSVGGDSTDKCQLVGGQPTPNPYVSVTAPVGTTKSFNFTTNVLCQNIY